MSDDLPTPIDAPTAGKSGSSRSPTCCCLDWLELLAAVWRSTHGVTRGYASRESPRRPHPRLPLRAELRERLIGDRAYDADPLDTELAKLGVEMIAPHRRNRTKPKTQNGRPLRRYRRRWKMERLFAWLGNFRRLVVRYERYALNYLGFVQLGCLLILLRWSV